MSPITISADASVFAYAARAGDRDYGLQANRCMNSRGT